MRLGIMIALASVQSDGLRCVLYSRSLERVVKMVASSVICLNERYRKMCEGIPSGPVCLVWWSALDQIT